MVKIIKETVSTQTGRDTTKAIEPVIRNATGLQSVQYAIYFLFGLIDVLLVFRLILKIMGASTASSFVRFIYGVTWSFILPFEGIFRREVNQGIETSSVLEPSAIVAVVVYILLAWGIVQLLQIMSGREQSN